MNKLRWYFVCLLAVLILPEPCAWALTNGKDDVNTPQANAVVNLKGAFLCTGALVAPDVVLSANHCWLTIPPAREGVESRSQQSEHWYPFTEEKVEVRFGNDKEHFLYRVRVTHYSVIGEADVRLLRLETPVPESIARPLPVLTRAPDAMAQQPRFWLKQRFDMVGWGQVEGSQGPMPRFRQIASGERGSYPCRMSLRGPDPQILCTHNRNRAQLLPGDSGGPLLWTDATGIQYVVGVGSSTTVHGGAYTATFYRGSSRSNGKASPDIAGWLEQALCADAQGHCPIPPTAPLCQRGERGDLCMALLGAISAGSLPEAIYKLEESAHHARLLVFDLGGRCLFESSWMKPELLRWDRLDTNGMPVANGLYLVVVQELDLNDRFISKVSKLAIVR